MRMGQVSFQCNPTLSGNRMIGADEADQCLTKKLDTGERRARSGNADESEVEIATRQARIGIDVDVMDVHTDSRGRSSHTSQKRSRNCDHGIVARPDAERPSRGHWVEPIVLQHGGDGGQDTADLGQPGNGTRREQQPVPVAQEERIAREAP